MEFLDKLVLPQSAHHMVLLKYLLVLTFILLIPYLSVLFGSLTLSLYFERKSAKTSDNKYYHFAKELIDQVTFNKGVAFALGLVPMLSAAFCYAQLLHLSGLSVPEFILIAFLFLLAAVILIYTYKYTYHLKEIFEFASNKSDSQSGLIEELESYNFRTSHLHKRSGWYGITLLTISIYIFIGAVQSAVDTNNWQNGSDLISIIISLDTITYFLQFLAASIGLTSAYTLYRNFRSNSGKEHSSASYIEFVKNFSLKTGLIATIILPALIILNIFSKPVESLSFNMFGASLAALFLLLFISILFYVMIKESNVKFSSMVIYLFVGVFTFIVIKDQFAFDTSTKKQFAMLAANYEEYHNKIKEEFGLAVKAISGADIYNGKCIACHKFDQKLVGPPYNETLPKYEGKRDQLIQFIMNPVKVNPDYPAMPNQGLKPKEAEAVTDYLLSTYKK